MAGLTDLQAGNQGLGGAVFDAVCSSQAGAADVANSMFETEINWTKTADDASAAATTAEFVLQTVPRRAMLVDLKYVPNGATGLNQSTTTYATLTLFSRNGVGGNALTLGATNTTPTANGGTGNWSQWNTVTFNAAAFDATNTVIPAGGMVTFSIAKVSTGVIVPAGTLTARIRYI